MCFKIKHYIICTLVIGYLCLSVFGTTDAFSNTTNSEESFSSSTNSEESFRRNATNFDDSSGNTTNLVASSWNAFPYVIQNETEAKIEHGIKSKLKDLVNKGKDVYNKVKNKVKNTLKEIGNKGKDKSKDIGKDYNKIGNKDTSGQGIGNKVNNKNKDIGSNYNKIKNKDTTSNWKHRDRYRKPDTTGGYSSSSDMPAILWIIFGIMGVSILIGAVYVCKRNSS